MRNDTTTLAGVELTTQELNDALTNGNRFLAKGRTLYAIFSDLHGVYSRPVYKERGSLPLVARGRFILADAKTANALVGFELCLA